MEIEILGPVRLRRDGRVVEILSRRERAALGLLALEAGRFVPAERLIDAVWGDPAPRHPAAALRTVLSRLRDTIAPVGIEVGPAGYRLAIDPLLVDSHRLEAPGATRAERREILRRWRGDPVPELEDWDRWTSYVEPLRDRRRRLEEELAAVAVDEGPDDDTLAELRRLVAEEPLREQRWALLARALAARGEPVEARREIQRARHVIRDEVGDVTLPLLDQLELGLDDGGSWVSGTAALARRSALVGRDAELAALRDALTGHPLVTVVGPPGVGKTRLAVDAVAGRDDAVVVDVSTAADEVTLVARLAAALGVVDVGDDRPDVALGRWLAARPRLVVLDDCDRVTAPAARIAAMIGECGGPVLVTCREPLGVPGEHVVSLGPLGDRDAAALLRRCVGPPALDPVVSDSLQAIVAETAGIPLAIELAATEARTSGVVETAERYSAGGARRADAVLARSIERSYQRLSTGAAQLLRRLVAFGGAFTTEAAAALVGGEATAAGELVDELARHSLVVAATTDGRTRYRLLPPVRRAAAAMASDEDRIAAQTGLRDHALAVARRLRVEWCGPRSVASMALLDHERDDLRAAMSSAIANGDMELAMTVCGALLEHAFRHVDREAFDWAQAALALPGADEHPDAERVHALAGYAAWYRGAGDGLACQLAAIEALSRREGQRPAGFALSLRAFHGTFFQSVPTLVGAQQWSDAAADMADPWWRIYHLAVLELVEIRPDWPRPPRAVATELADELDDPTARLFLAWGRIGELKADLPAAIPHLEQLLVDSRRLGDVFIAGAALVWLTGARFQVDPAAGRATFAEWLDHWAPTGDRIQLLTGLAHLRLTLQRHGLDDAFAIADELVRTWSVSVWHVAQSEPLLDPGSGAKSGVGLSRSVVGSEAFLASIARLRHSLIG